jgi:hypothetical protein
VEDDGLEDLIVLVKNILLFDIGSDQLFSQLANEVLALEERMFQVEKVALAFEQLLLQDVVQ